MANKVNIQLTNLICFRRITSGMITFGTTRKHEIVRQDFMLVHQDYPIGYLNIVL